MTRDDARIKFFGIVQKLDPMTIRFALGIASIVWAIAMFIGPYTFSRRGWFILSDISNETVWAVIFLLHGVATFWRLLDPISRPGWALVVNCYGWFIWFFVALATNLALGAFSPGGAMEWTMVAMQTFVIIRTGLKREVVSL